MAKVTFKIYGVHQRDEMIENLSKQLNNNVDVYYDDRENGGGILYTAKKAWLSPIQDGETHRCVFTDDLIVCDNFIKIAETIAQERPWDIISFFPVGYMKFTDDDVKELNLNPNTHNYLPSIGFSGCAIMMPVEYIRDIYKHADDNGDDELVVLKYAAKNHIKTITILPSVVQHIGDVSLVNGAGLHGAELKTQFFVQQQDELWNLSK